MKGKYKYLIILVIGVGIILRLSNSKSYASSDIYTRNQLEEMVVSTALSYYYNNRYTDYEGGSPDDALSEWPVNYSLSPEMIGTSKSLTSQCEAFTATCYMYTFDFNFKKFKSSLTDRKYTSYINANTKTRVNATSGDTAFYNTYKYFNKVFSVGFLNAIAADIVNGEYPNDSSMLVLTYQQGKVTNIDGINTTRSVTELVNDGTITKEYIISNLRPGDIILNDGHAMLWVGDAIESGGGIIHSTGSSYKYVKAEGASSIYNVDTFTSGQEDYDVRYSSADFVFENNIKTHGGNENAVITILRPINSICESWNGEVCNSINSSYAKIRDGNTLARTKLNSLKTEQYVYDYTGERNLSTDSSSVNVGDIISYRLKIKNMSVLPGNCTKYGQVTQYACEKNGGVWNESSNVNVSSNVAKNYSNIVVSAKIPAGTEFVSSEVCDYNRTSNKCTTGGTYSNGIVTWSVSELNAGKDTGYYYNVRVKNPTNGVISNEGMEIDYDNVKLKMGNINTRVNFSINSKSGSSFLTQIDSDVAGNISCTSSLEDYIIPLYNNYFPNYNFSEIITPSNILGGAFNSNEGGVFENRSYTIKRDFNNSLTGNEKIINKMLVPYVFGGRKYENLLFEPTSNMEQYRKVYPIWSSYKNFNIGDIIITLKDSSSGFKIDNAWLYTGYATNPTYVYCRYGKIVKHSSLKLPSLNSDAFDESTMYSEKEDIKTLFYELNKELPESEKNELNSILGKTTLTTDEMNKLIQLKKYLIVQKKKQNYANTYLLYLLHTSDLYLVLRPSQLYEEKDMLTVTVTKDNSNWDNSGINVALYQNGIKKYDSSISFASGPNVMFLGANPGTYNVYASSSSDSSGVNTLVDTGETVMVNTSPKATIDYSTISGGTVATLNIDEVTHTNPEFGSGTNESSESGTNESSESGTNESSESGTNESSESSSNGGSGGNNVDNFSGESNSHNSTNEGNSVNHDQNDNPSDGAAPSEENVESPPNPQTGISSISPIIVIIVVVLCGTCYFYMKTRKNNI